jgi:hypothetical protein
MRWYRPLEEVLLPNEGIKESFLEWVFQVSLKGNKEPMVGEEWKSTPGKNIDREAEVVLCIWSEELMGKPWEMSKGHRKRNNERGTYSGLLGFHYWNAYVFLFDHKGCSLPAPLTWIQVSVDIYIPMKFPGCSIHLSLC